MESMRQIHITDCTLLEASLHTELSFREKIEICRLIDKLGVSYIDLNPIRQKKIDSLLIKSVCSAVQHASVSVPVSLTEPDSVRITWEALSEARNPRLQVVAPVSSVQMEYLLHMKSKAVLETVEKTVSECRKLTENVEFIAADATRSDTAFLVQIIKTAIQAGAQTVTLCDTAASMLPEETSAFISDLYQSVPEMNNIRLGYYCSGDLNMADSCAFSAIRSGAAEIKAIACPGNCISMLNIVRILSTKGSAVNAFSRVGIEQIRRITGQIGKLCSNAGRKTVAYEEELNSRENEEMLNAHDTFETILHATEKLGYDLSPEDQQKVWKCFCQTAERKEQISLKELDAMIAAEALQVPPAYHSIQYVINTGNQIGAMAHMKLMFHNEALEGIASGDGAIDAAFNSIEKATGRHFELDEFRIQAVTEGREAMGETIVRLRWEGKLYSGRGISTDIVGAGIMAYINAVNKIVYEEEEA